MNPLNAVEESISYIKKHSNIVPEVSVTLGSGLGHFIEKVEVDCAIPYSDIPGFHAPSVEGHSGQLVLGHLHDKPIALLQGRIHYYEGHSMSQVVHPTRVLAALGVKNMIITNSAGGLSKIIEPGTFMIIRDIINFTGENPLRGANVEQWGPRFPDMSEPFHSEMSNHLESLLIKNNVPYINGIYVGVQGPTYETAAEIRMFAQMGASAVGMSTVPEVIVARHMGCNVVGVSCITNLGTGLSHEKLSHDDVKEVAQRVSHQFSEFLSDFVQVQSFS